MNRTQWAIVPALTFCLAHAAAADVVTDWNAVMVRTVAVQNPFAQARSAAIAQLAVFEAVNAIKGEFDSYLVTALPVPSPADADAAAVAAAHRVLITLVPAAAASLDAARAASLSAIPDGQAKVNGVAVGEAAAAAMLASRVDDGAVPPAFHLPGSSDPGEWQLTAGCPAAGGILAHWGNVAPFGLKDAEQFKPAPPPPLSSRQYARAFNEVKEVGALQSPVRPAHLTDVARFYAVVLAVATWNPAAAQVAVEQRRSLSFNARLFALMNMAISDALVAVMHTKYEHVFWRPETAIPNADRDGNPDTEADIAWQPLLPTPCFPSYGSAHAAASYAARRVLERLLGDRNIVVELAHPAAPGIVLDYDSFDAITEDIDDARVYGGIHFRFDQRAGASQGEKIGAWMVSHHLRSAGGGNE
jgi:hypothetical protein